MTNRERFREAYDAALRDEHARNPGDYAYPAEKISEVVDKMVAAHGDRQGANIGPSAKRAAKACGIKATYKAIYEFLNSDREVAR